MHANTSFGLLVQAVPHPTIAGLPKHPAALGGDTGGSGPSSKPTSGRSTRSMRELRRGFVGAVIVALIAMVVAVGLVTDGAAHARSEAARVAGAASGLLTISQAGTAEAEALERANESAETWAADESRSGTRPDAAH